MIKLSSHNKYLVASEKLFSVFPFNFAKGLLSAYVAFPLAERFEKRELRGKISELSRFYRLPAQEQKNKAIHSLVEVLGFVKMNVPYYRDLFDSIGFDPESIKRDLKYFQDVPYLTKEIINEQGERLYSQSLSDIRHYMCKTGGSTGVSCHIPYDQTAADYASATVLFARDYVGNSRLKHELHFACRFPDAVDPGWPTRESFKGFAMNRSNVFFDRLDDIGLSEIWGTINRRRPYMVHAHPSTIYALANYVEKHDLKSGVFPVFESSGEVLQPYMRETISRALDCRVVDRYGLAELGVLAYELDGKGLRVLTSEGWAESRVNDRNDHELILTGFRNRLMPIIRYVTGDLAQVEETGEGFFLKNVMGRIHDIVVLDDVEYPTHTLQDLLDHRVGGIKEFQIDVRGEEPILKIVPESDSSRQEIIEKANLYLPGAMKVEFVNQEDLVRVGSRSKFRHVVDS